MLEVVSTLTNLTFIIVGLFILKRSWYVGLTTILLGIASAGWHWTLQPFWHTFDLGMMYFMLLSLVDYSTGSGNTRTAFLAGTGMVGLHFILPSDLMIATIAFILLLTLIRHYSADRILIIVACFTLWITTNIPYLHEWSVSFWKLDVLHGISHICASVGIYKTVSYKPTTFSELAKSFKSIHFPTLKAKARTELDRIIDVELNPVFGNRAVEAIQQQDIHRLLEHIEIKKGNRTMAKKVRSGLNQIFEFAKDRGIKHNPLAEILQHYEGGESRNAALQKA